MIVAFAHIARKHWNVEFCPEAFLQSKVAQLWLDNLYLWSTSASVEADLAKEVKPLKNTLPSFILVGIKSRYKFAGLSHTKYLCLLNGRLSLICLSLALSRILLFSWKNKAARSDHLKKTVDAQLAIREIANWFESLLDEQNIFVCAWSKAVPLAIHSRVVWGFFDYLNRAREAIWDLALSSSRQHAVVFARR